MLVKVFESEEMSSALQMVRETLGPDALILSTRTVRKGRLGLFGKPILEVTAAAESPDLGTADGPFPSAPRKPAFSTTDGAGEEELRYRDLWKQRKVIDPLEEEVREIKRSLASNDMSALRKELDELKGMLRQVDAGSRSVGASCSGRSGTPAKKTVSLQHFMDELTRRGVEAETAETISSLAREKLSAGQLRNYRALRKFFRDSVGDLVRVTGPIFSRKRHQQRVALVGPTGVGKTTTLAKLAAEYLGQCAGRAALVTVDTFRIAAVEQLKVYGEIMNLPVEVAFSPADLQAAFARHDDKELIFIDTAGCSPRDDRRLEELAALLGPETGTQNHLVLSAPTRNRELRETVQRFGRLPMDSIIFTKLDECEDCGALINIPVGQNLPISFLTNGQRVPEDLLAAESSTVADFIMGHS